MKSSISDQIRKALFDAAKAAGFEARLEDIVLEHPAAQEHGDYSTNVALKIKKKKSFLENVKWLLETVNKENFHDFSEPVLVGRFNPEVTELLKAKTDLVVLKPLIFAKLAGWVQPKFRGHAEVIGLLAYLPLICYEPQAIYKDKEKRRFIFSYEISHFGILVVEVSEERQQNEIVTMFLTDKKWADRFEKIWEGENSFPGRRRISSLQAFDFHRSAGAGLSSLRESQGFYNTLDLESQEKILFYEEKLNSLEIVEKIVNKINKSSKVNEISNKIAVAEPGFINFWLNKEWLVEDLGKEDPGNDSLAGKKIMVEFAHPNTHKQFHIGHLRNITLGESIVRLLETSGAKVIRANYQGDVGMHVAKALWGVQKLGKSDGAYVFGNKAFEEDEEAKKEIVALNSKIYEKDPEIMPLWKKTRQESLDYFDKIYKRVYTHFDRFYFESEVAGRGKELVLQNVGKVFEESDRAIVFRGEHTRVFINSEGNPTYEAKDIGLGELQFKEYNPDLILHNVGPEQVGYFRVVFEALAQIFPQTRGKEQHLAYGWVQLKEGKMSSRTGNVVLGERLLDEIKKRLEEKYPDRVSDFEPVAVAAAKYSLLKVGSNTEIAFDIDESISLEGDSGPYLQYTYARAKSVLRKSESQKTRKTREPEKPETPEELAVLRYLYRFPEVVEQAAKNYAPNLVCAYLFELAKRFNNFYNNCPILGNEFRLKLTQSTAQVLKNGLNLLGIEALERM